MAMNWQEVNWFRFSILMSVAFLASMMFDLGDEHLSTIEIARTTIGALIAGVAFLQCPEAVRKTEKNDGTK